MINKNLNFGEDEFHNEILLLRFLDKKKERAEYQRNLWKNPEKRKRFREVQSKYEREYVKRPDVKVRRRKQSRKHYVNNVLKFKELCYLAYGNNEIKCSCCGEKEIKFLTLDHVKNDGAEERRTLKGKRGVLFYKYLASRGFPDKERYQVLCMNCNQGRNINKGICPHKVNI